MSDLLVSMLWAYLAGFGVVNVLFVLWTLRPIKRNKL